MTYLPKSSSPLLGRAACPDPDIMCQVPRSRPSVGPRGFDQCLEPALHHSTGVLSNCLVFPLSPVTPQAQGLITLGPLTLFHTLLRRERITLPVCSRTFSTDQRLKRARVEDEHWGLRTGAGDMARHDPVGKDVT